MVGEQNCILSFLLSATPARAVLFLFSVLETNVPRENLPSEFSHSLDPFQTVDNAERYAREIPETRLVRIKSAGHILMENDPKAVAGALAAER